MTATLRGTPADAPARGAPDVHVTMHPVHTSLVRPVLHAGVERPVLALEGTLGFALLAGVGPHLATLALAAAVVLVLHPTMVWLTASDPSVTAVYLRNRRHAEYFAPTAAAHTAVPRPAPSVPTAS